MHIFNEGRGTLTEAWEWCVIHLHLKLNVWGVSQVIHFDSSSRFWVLFNGRKSSCLLRFILSSLSDIFKNSNFLIKEYLRLCSSSYFSKIKKTKTGTLDKDFVRCTPLKLIYLDAKSQLNYWTLNVSMKSLSSVCKSVCPSVYRSYVRPSLTFLKIGSLFFLIFYMKADHDI